MNSNGLAPRGASAQGVVAAASAAGGSDAPCDACAASGQAQGARVNREFNFPDFPIKLEKHPAIEQRDAKNSRARAPHPVSVIAEYFIEPGNNANEQELVQQAFHGFMLDKENKGAAYLHEFVSDKMIGAYAGLIEDRSTYERTLVENGSWERDGDNLKAWKKIPLQYQDAEMVQLARKRYGMPLHTLAQLRPCHVAPDEWLHLLQLLEEFNPVELRDKLCRKMPDELLASKDFRRKAVVIWPDFLRFVRKALELGPEDMEKEWGNTLVKAAAHRKLDEFPESARTRRVCRERLVINARPVRDRKQEGAEEWRSVPKRWQQLPTSLGDDCIWLYNCGGDTLRLRDLPAHVQRNPIVIQEYVEAHGDDLESVDPRWLDAQPHLYEKLCTSAVRLDPDVIRHVRGGDAWQFELWVSVLNSDPQQIRQLGSSHLPPLQKTQLCEKFLTSERVRKKVSDFDWPRIEEQALLEMALVRGDDFLTCDWMRRVPKPRLPEFKLSYYNACVERHIVASFHKIPDEYRNRRQARVIFPRVVSSAESDLEAAIAIRSQAAFLTVGQRRHLLDWLKDDPATRKTVEIALTSPQDGQAPSRKRSRDEPDHPASASKTR